MKALTWLVILVIVVFGVWYLWGRGSSRPATVPTTAPQATNTQQAPAPTPPASVLSSGQSDAELNADLSQIDTQLQEANSASAAASQTDTPVTQTE